MAFLLGKEKFKIMSNFYLLSDANESFFPASDVEKVKTNIKIIKLVKQLEISKKQPTSEQQELLAKYVGWGGLANSFFDEYNKKYALERAELKSVVSDDEYRAMKKSSLTAYYTNPAIARAMWEKVVNDGFEGGNVLDPSMGTGIFFMTMPESLRSKTNLYGIELDSITGQIAKYLFPDAHIYIKGFEDFKVVKSPFDLVITNVPFGDVRILDENGDKTYYIHDYFVKKSLDLTNNKGLVYLIASTGVMDKRTGNIFQNDFIKENSDFLGSVRLPNDAFKQIAGTQVTTDIIFLEKHIATSSIHGFNDEVSANVDCYYEDANNKVYINDYYTKHPEQMLGKPNIKTYQGGHFTLDSEGDMFKKLPEAISKTIKPLGYESDAPVETGAKVIVKKSKEELLAEDDYIPYEFVKDDDNNIIYCDDQTIFTNSKLASINFYFDANGIKVGTTASKNQLKLFEEVANSKPISVYCSKSATSQGKFKGKYKRVYFFQAPYSKTELERLSGMIDIKNAYLALISDQLETNGHKLDDFDDDLKKLNKIYDKFVNKYGNINLTVNSRLFEKDNRFPLVASLEDQKINPKTGNPEFVKSMAFKKPMVTPNLQIADVNSAVDALLTSISEGRGVDFRFMQAIYPRHNEAQIKEELGDHILIDVQQYVEKHVVEYVTKEKFLSGDVVTKKETVEKLISQKDETADWKHYLKLLEKVIPKPLSISDISFKLSSAWIPDDVLSKFIFENFVLNSDKAPSVDSYEKDDVGNWIIPNYIGHTIRGRHIFPHFLGDMVTVHNDQMGLSIDGNIAFKGSQIFDNLLNSNQPIIKKIVDYDKNGRPIREVDDTATQSLRDKEKEMEQAFRDFVLGDVQISNELEDTYNYEYNRYVERKYDGSHLHINGLAKGYELRDYQKNAVERIIETKRALLAHEVGTGKTLTMISAGFKLKELGLISRPLFVVPTNLVAQFGQDILKFYPTKKVLIATGNDFKKENRKRFLARIITQNYDAIVIGHSQFEKLQVSPEYEAQFFKDQLNDLLDNIEDMKDQDFTVKGLQARADAFDKHIKALKFKAQDTFLTFEDLGVDFLFVDEAHNYKNIAPITTLGQIKGINSTTSKRAFDMQMKVNLLHDKYNQTHVVFATGTPVSNSISELWTMMQYIQPDVLKKFNIDKFDNFAGSFGLIDTDLELDPTGSQYKPRKRFVKFVNLPELMTIYRTTADIQMASSLNLKLPTAKRFVITSTLTDAQEDYLDELIERADDVASRSVDPREDNMLKITNDARKMTVDMRLISDDYEDEDSEKLQQVVDNVYRIYKRTNFIKGTQMIFSDIGTPTASKGFNIYSQIKQMLIEKGVPANEIAFMHDAKNEDAKLELQRKMNAGEVRVLIGSTQKGGTGLNVQLRMKATHHIDVPWRPSDIIQRNGRLVRQGNKFKQVEIYHYITKGSFDNYLWQIQENKLKYITQVMTTRSAIRAMHDVDDDTLTAGDFKSIATSNPYLKLKMQVDNRVAMLNNQKHAFERNRSARQENIKQAKIKLPKKEQELEQVIKDATDEDGNLIDFSNLQTVDFRFPDAPESYDKPSEVNARLYSAIKENSDYWSNEKDKVIATIGGFRVITPKNITIDYRGKRAGLLIQKNTDLTYYVSVPFNYWWRKADPYLAQSIIRVVKGFKTRVRNYKAEIGKIKDTIKMGIGDATFKFADDLAYLEAKKQLLDIHISDPTDEIAEQLKEFDQQWQKDHPDYTIDEEQQDKQEAIKYHSNPNDYDDSLFDDDAPIATKQEVVKKSVETPKPETKVEKTKTSEKLATVVEPKKQVKEDNVSAQELTKTITGLKAKVNKYEQEIRKLKNVINTGVGYIANKSNDSAYLEAKKAVLDNCLNKSSDEIVATLKEFDQEWKQVHTAKVEAKVKESNKSKKLAKLAKPKKQAKDENVQVLNLFDFSPKDADKKSKKDDKEKVENKEEVSQLSLF